MHQVTIDNNRHYSHYNINDFSRSFDLLFSILFSDDTSVFFIEGTSYDKVIDIVNNELEGINIWLRANHLTINIKRLL